MDFSYNPRQPLITPNNAYTNRPTDDYSDDLYGLGTEPTALAELKALVIHLSKNKVPGPLVMRLEKEFNLRVGGGGESTLYQASKDFTAQLHAITAHRDRADTFIGDPCSFGNNARTVGRDFQVSPRLAQSMTFWRTSLVKRPRSDRGYKLGNQVRTAFTEIRLLSLPSLRRNPHIVTLRAWGLCLDSLENPALEVSRLPLLILEKARFDLSNFITSPFYTETSYSDLCTICLGIGLGLEALHAEGINHGDIKTQNVLLFESSSPQDGKFMSKSRWRPKLCDLGSATMPKDRITDSMRIYRGTEGWKPPESIPKVPLENLEMCDLFTYGLVVWCLFVGQRSSPLPDQDEQNPATSTIQAHDATYTIAERALLSYYGLTKSNVGLQVSPMAGASTKSPQELSAEDPMLRMTRKPHLNLSQDQGKVQIEHILLVLRETLSHDPEQRHHQPWQFMDLERYSAIDGVSQLTKTSIAPSPTSGSLVMGLLMKYCCTGVRLFDDLIPLYNWTKRVTTLCTRSFLPLLWSRVETDPGYTAREETFIKVHASLNDSLCDYRDGRSATRLAVDDIHSICDFGHHQNDQCYDFGPLIRLRHILLGEISATDTTLENRLDYLYAYARLRSRVRLCCWKRSDQAFDVSSLDDAAVPKFPIAQTWLVQEYRLLCVTSEKVDLATLAWLCRGEVAHAAVRDIPSHCRAALWGRLFSRKFNAADRTERMVLFLEQGHEIWRFIQRGSKTRSVPMSRSVAHTVACLVYHNRLCAPR